MAQLLHKTNGDISPRGLPRVYFTCHPEDFSLYFQDTIREILAISNCAVYYYDEEPELDEDYFLNLSRMNLVVMPITGRLLYKPNRTVDVEFLYAQEHHIPVLPLMQSSGLEQKYNEKFGDLQFLDKHNTDPTALPYGEKLKKYLEAVLVGDELSAKVRAAFDAYIFLSYRKKDRILAQKLMKLIHRSPSCRDFAVWYDEFLIPGENFNDAIRAALKKSELFVLAVTPNLVNESNYIMTTEYPMARKEYKPILPARMQETDPEALREMYEGIPDSVDPEDEGQFTELLLDALQNLAKRENDNDPAHNFFIGLAYLTGIDVEVNHDFAVKMITSAAESGLTEAMKKLVSMYESGEGVKRNCMTAIAWREKLVEQVRCRWEAAKTEQNGVCFVSALLELGDALGAQNLLSRAKRAYLEAKKTAEFMRIRFRDDRTKYWKFEHYCCDRLHDVAMAEHDPGAAHNWLTLTLIQRIEWAKSGNPEDIRNLWQTYLGLGNIAEKTNGLDRAKNLYGKMLALAEQLAEKEPAVSLKLLHISHRKLGDIAWREKSLEEAKNRYSQALEIAQRLTDHSGEEGQLQLCVLFLSIGNIELDAGNLTTAKTWYSKTAETAGQLVKAGNILGLSPLEFAHSKLGDIAIREQNVTETKNHYGLSLEIAERLAQRETPETLRRLSVNYDLMGNLSIAEHDLTSAKLWYHKAMEIAERLAKSRMPEDLRSLGISYTRMGDLDKSEENLAAAKKWYEKSLEIFEKLAQSGTNDALLLLSSAYSLMGDIAYAQKDMPTAKSWFRKSLDIAEKLSRFETPGILRILCDRYAKMGKLANLQNDPTAAKDWYRKELAVYEQLEEENLTVDDLWRMTDCCFALSQDLAFLEKALVYWDRLEELSPRTYKSKYNREDLKAALPGVKKILAIKAYPKKLWSRIFRGRKEQKDE